METLLAEYDSDIVWPKLGDAVKATVNEALSLAYKAWKKSKRNNQKVRSRSSAFSASSASTTFLQNCTPLESAPAHPQTQSVPSTRKVKKILFGPNRGASYVMFFALQYLLLPIRILIFTVAHHHFPLLLLIMNQSQRMPCL
jgi:hypothetical protein